MLTVNFYLYDNSTASETSNKSIEDTIADCMQYKANSAWFIVDTTGKTIADELTITGIKRPILFAHIFKARTKQWSLIISDSAEINGNHVISETLYDTKPEAKKAAKLLNAKPWNY